MKILKHLRSDWFRYGFETVAVVVGILIAFALDNWNEDRKQELLEIEYLNGLVADLANDTTYYNYRIANSDWIIEHHREFILQMHVTQNNLEEVRALFKHVDNIYDSSFTMPNNEWDFFNDPSSERFQTIEYTVGVYRLKHLAFLNHFVKLKNMSIQLIHELQNEMESRTRH